MAHYIYSNFWCFLLFCFLNILIPGIPFAYFGIRSISDAEAIECSIKSELHRFIYNNPNNTDYKDIFTIIINTGPRICNGKTSGYATMSGRYLEDKYTSILGLVALFNMYIIVIYIWTRLTRPIRLEFKKGLPKIYNPPSSRDIAIRNWANKLLMQSSSDDKKDYGLDNQGLDILIKIKTDILYDI